MRFPPTGGSNTNMDDTHSGFSMALVGWLGTIQYTTWIFILQSSEHGEDKISTGRNAWILLVRLLSVLKPLLLDEATYKYFMLHLLENLNP